MSRKKEALDRAVADLTSEKIDALVQSMRTPIELATRSGEWISAREARLFVSDHAKVTLADAEKTLCRRALQWVPCKVDSFGRREDPHDYIDRIEFFDGRDDDFSHFHERPLPKAWSEIRDMFLAVASHIPILVPSGVYYADWAAGDFKVEIERDFSNVTLEITGLQFDRRALAQSIGVKLSDNIRSTDKRMSEDELREWLGHSKHENSKIAWTALRSEFGNRCPKKSEAFAPIWRELKGGRGRGRPKKNGP